MPEFELHDCEAAFRHLDGFLDRDLTADEQRCVRAHLEVCAECAECFEFEASVIRCIRQKLEAIDMPCDLALRIKVALDRCECE